MAAEGALPEALGRSAISNIDSLEEGIVGRADRRVANEAGSPFAVPSRSVPRISRAPVSGPGFSMPDRQRSSAPLTGRIVGGESVFVSCG